MSFKNKKYFISGLILLAGLFFLLSVSSVWAADCEKNQEESSFFSALNPLISFTEKTLKNFGYEVALAQAPRNWVYCAAEGETCSFSGTYLVRYGTDTDGYIYTVFTNGVLCSESVFGPAPGDRGVAKHCDYDVANPNPDYCGSDSVGCSGTTPTATINWSAAPGSIDVAYFCYYRLMVGGTNYDISSSPFGPGCRGDRFSGNPATDNTYKITSGLADNTNYGWRVEAYYFTGPASPSGDSSASLGVTDQPQGSFITPNCAPPSPPTGLSASCPSPGTSATVSWNAVFGATYYPLRVNNIADGWDGSCSSAGGDFCEDVYGTSYSFTSIPGASYSWWLHSCNANGCNWTTVEGPNFTCTVPTYTLTVTKAGTGSGTVNSNTPGINCGSDCSESYTSGASVDLVASASSSSTFTGWSGACSGTGICTVSMTQARSVTATFTINTYTLTVTKAGTGSGTVNSNTPGINCGSDCSESYTSGASVDLVASASSSSTFTGWSGACSGTGTCTVSMTQDRSVTATFNIANQDPVAVATISKDGSTYAGSITVTRGVSTPIYLSAVGSSDPNGWTDATNGVSSDGKCEWNRDLNQGAPTFEPPVVNNPASPSACNISLGNLIFNDTPGTYTYQVLRITDKPGLQSNIDTVSVTVQAPLNNPPSANLQPPTQPDYCIISWPAAIFSWNFTDPDGDTQSAYQIQVDNNSNFSSPEVDSCVPSPGTCQSGNTSNSYATLPGALSWNTTYYWQLKVWDSTDLFSDWISGSFFTIPRHEHPTINFSWTPQNPAPNENVQFTDQSTVYGGSTKSSWSWTFQNGSPANSSIQNPVVRFLSSGAKSVTLRVTDSDGFSCQAQKTINSQLPPPEWKEIPPF